MFWFAGLLLAFITVVLALLIAFYFIQSKESRSDHVSVKDKLEFIKKFLPLSRKKGWRLSMVRQGLPVWEKDLHVSWSESPVQACSVVLPVSAKVVLNALSNNDVRLEWDYSLDGISNVTMTTKTHQGEMLTDVVSIKPSSALLGYLGLLWSSATRQERINCSRFWHLEADGYSWMLSMNIEQSFLMPEWTCYIIENAPKADNSALCDQVKLTAFISSPLIWLSYSDVLTSRIIGLREYLVSSRVGSVKVDQMTTSAEIVNGEQKEVIGTLHIPSPAQQILRGQPIEDKSLRYHGEIQMAKEELMKGYYADVGQDGWSFYQDYKGVRILKKAAAPGVTSFDAYKGTAVVAVPAVYGLKYVASLEHRGQWDHDYNIGFEVEVFDKVTQVANLKYKPLWPTTARDFLVVAKSFQTDDGLAALCTKTVTHPSCPEAKGYVRAEILVAGFVVKPLTLDPPTCSITYLTHADFKGNLPIRLVNKASSEQPQLVAVLREKLEALYKSDQLEESNTKTPAAFHAQADDLWAATVAAYDKENDHSSSDDIRDSTSDVSSLSEESPRQFENGETDYESIDPSEGIPVSDVMQLPMADRFTVDFKVLANQAAAGLLGELLLATQVNIDADSKQVDGEQKTGEWTYQGMEKDVVIMRKIFEDQPFHCFLGKGIINETPMRIWDVLRDHTTRYQYDRMLKKSKIVKQIDEHTKILYMHHETMQCFVKQARDFVVLATDRIENNKYVLAAVSVDIPECPPEKNLVRSKVLASGWVIEPVLQNGQLCSMVSYLSQVDFGGFVPTRLLNVVARRQPLSIAYLRLYLSSLREAGLT